MSEIVYIDGEFLPKDQAKISVFDHGVLYGDGVFEGIRYYQRNIFRLEEHIERLLSSAKYILLDVPWSAKEIADAVVETCRRNKQDDGYLRLCITRGQGTLGLNPYLCPKPTMFIIATKIQLYPAEYYEKGLPIITAATRRYHAGALSPRVKSLNYLNNIMAKLEAVHSGTLEAIMLDDQGFIVECTGDNVFAVKKGVLYTPPTYQGALRGITRDAVIEIAGRLGITVKEERLTLYEAYDADEFFLTGTAAEIVPVIEIDKRKIGNHEPGPITREIRGHFHELTTVDGVRF
ncbi:branched-chain-amino-acid transaminase [bacterium]|nr:branched-chain-amino-acid transaminase [bacterium]